MVATKRTSPVAQPGLRSRIEKSNFPKFAMKQNLIVSSKGQITLPAAMRRALGLQGNAIVTAEQQGGRIVLAPAMVVETEVYSDEAVRAWQREDAFAPGEREAIARKLEIAPQPPPSPAAAPARSKQRSPRRR